MMVTSIPVRLFLLTLAMLQQRSENLTEKTYLPYHFLFKPLKKHSVMKNLKGSYKIQVRKSSNCKPITCNNSLLGAWLVSTGLGYLGY